MCSHEVLNDSSGPYVYKIYSVASYFYLNGRPVSQEDFEKIQKIYQPILHKTLCQTPLKNDY